MKLSEIIHQLKQIQEEHGDLSCFIDDGNLFEVERIDFENLEKDIENENSLPDKLVSFHSWN